MRFSLFSLFVLFFVVTPTYPADQEKDFSTALMKSTFMIESILRFDSKSWDPSLLGTAFIMGLPKPSDEKVLDYVLLTANHVLDSIKDKHVALVGRSKGANGYNRVTFTLEIRKNGTPLWIKHPEADVAAMFVPMPEKVRAVIPLIPTDLLATDEELKKYEVRPGEELLVLGYPLGINSNNILFPILRSGRIASYPLIPTKDTKTFYMDFLFLPGSSGGPVYLVSKDRSYGGTTHLGSTIRMIMGIVSGSAELEEKTLSLEIKTRLGLAKVVHASLIKEVLDILLQKTR